MSQKRRNSIFFNDKIGSKSNNSTIHNTSNGSAHNNSSTMDRFYESSGGGTDKSILQSYQSFNSSHDNAIDQIKFKDKKYSQGNLTVNQNKIEHKVQQKNNKIYESQIHLYRFFSKILSQSMIRIKEQNSKPKNQSFQAQSKYNTLGLCKKQLQKTKSAYSNCLDEYLQDNENQQFLKLSQQVQKQKLTKNNFCKEKWAQAWNELLNKLDNLSESQMSENQQIDDIDISFSLNQFKKHIPQQLMNKSSKRLDSILKIDNLFHHEYLQKLFGTKQQKQKRYNLIEDKTLLNFYKQKSIHLSSDYFYLNYDRMPLNIKFFVNCQDWFHLQYLSLIDCQINDQSWRQIYINFKKFKNLKVLNMSLNNIQTIEKRQLLDFNSLKYVNLTYNNLTQKSIQQLNQLLAMQNQMNKQNVSKSDIQVVKIIVSF